MTRRASLGPMKIYSSMLGSGYNSSCGGDSMDGRRGSLAKSGKDTYLIVQGGRLEELVESSKMFTSRV